MLHMRVGPQSAGGGGGTRLRKIGRGVPSACSKPDPVAIRLMAKKTPCSNFEINTEFNLLVNHVYDVYFYQYTSCFMVFLNSLICLCNFKAMCFEAREK